MAPIYGLHRKRRLIARKTRLTARKAIPYRPDPKAKFDLFDNGNGYSRNPTERRTERCRILQEQMEYVSKTDFVRTLTLSFLNGPFRGRRSGSDSDDDDDSSSDESSFNEEDDDPRAQELLSQLCSEVAPKHPGIYNIKLIDLEAPSKYLRMLADSLTSESCAGREPLTLYVMSNLDLVSAGVIATVLRRNGPVDDLRLDGCGTEACRLICDGMKGNERLHKMEITCDNVTVKGDTIRQAVDATSPLQSLSIFEVDWTEEGVASLWSQLRTNERLEFLKIDDVDELDCGDLFIERMKETLSTFNWTLNDVRGKYKNLPVHELLEQNARIREAVSVLEGQSYGVDKVSLWPNIMSLVSSKPTLLYRLLRRGNSDAWSAHVLTSSDATASSAKKRRRQ